MIDHYQPFLFPFLSFRSSLPSVFTKRYYYWSWEDGLWDLLEKKHIEKGSTVLVPDFYCTDVVENIQSHGYAVRYYKLDKHFQVKKQALLRSIQRHHPSVVIVFHAAGISSTVVSKPSVIQAITKKALLIEDCVHRVLDPQTVQPVNEQHFIMDSLRKVTPLYGSFLYGTKKGMAFTQTKRGFSPYVVYTTCLHLLFRIVLMASHILNKSSLAAFAHTKLLKRHDDIIGNTASHRGIWVIAWMSQWLNREGLQKKKKEQVRLYEYMLKSVFRKSSPFYRINIKRGDYGKLHAYPVGLKGKTDEALLLFLKQKNIVVFPKFADSRWAVKHNVLFFPLGFHIHKEMIKHSVKTLTAWKNGVLQEAVQTAAPSPHLLVRAAQFILSF